MSNLIIYFKPTENCNLSCLHCYNKKDEMIFNPLNFRVLDKFLNEISKKYENINFVFHGGEPSLLKVDYLEYVYNMAKKCFITNNLQISIQSNLTILYDELLNFYKKLGSVGTSFSPYIRFYGNDFKYYNKWIKNLKTLYDNDIKTHVVITLSKKYIKTATPYNLLQFLIDNHFSSFHFEPLTKNGEAIKNWDEISINKIEYDKWKSEFTKLYIDDEYYNDIFCNDIILKSKSFIDGIPFGCSKRECHKTVLTINSDGTVGTCPNVSNEKVIGNISYNIENILKSSIRTELCIEEMKKRDECLLCEHYSYCNGGCMYLDDCYEGKEFFNTIKSYYNNDKKYKEFIDNYDRK